MASGSVTADKWVRIRAWIARHLVDLDSPDANPNSDNYPSAGVVAHLLWGSGPSKRAAQRALEYAERIVTRLEEENRNKYVEGEAMAKFEVRTTPANFEIREDDTGMYFEGYAAVFDSPSEPLPFIERIARGAFRNSLKKSRNDIKLLWNHDTNLVLGSSRAKTLTLIEDERGLKVSAQLPNTTAGRDAKELLARGDVDSMSFGFSVPSGGDVWNSEGTERTLKSVRLHEVSIVAFPAYTATAGTTSVRGLDLVAERSMVDADELSDAIVMMEAGGTLTTEAANILRKVIDALEIEDEPMQEMEEPSLDDSPEESEDSVAVIEENDNGDFSALELVKAKLWLLERK
jgi:HK97 family phage prohead protease